jgi:hypothetical protein
MLSLSKLDKSPLMSLRQCIVCIFLLCVSQCAVNIFYELSIFFLGFVGILLFYWKLIFEQVTSTTEYGIGNLEFK